MLPPGRPTIVVVTPDGAEVTSWPLTGAGCPDLALADRLARCQLAARRLGWTIEIHGAEATLAGLLALLGWSDVVVTVVAVPEGSEALGQTEQREQRRVDEVVVTDDPPV